MKTISAVLVAGTLSLATMLALADDRTTSDVSAAEQAKMKQEAAATKANFAKMTPEERAVAKKTSDAEREKYQDAIIKQTQNPAESRNMAINKSAAASKAGPTPQRDYINTPEAEQKMLKQKGQ